LKGGSQIKNKRRGLIKHSEQVTIQTCETREATQRGTALERSVVVTQLGSFNLFYARQTSLLAKNMFLSDTTSEILTMVMVLFTNKAHVKNYVCALVKIQAYENHLKANTNHVNIHPLILIKTYIRIIAHFAHIGYLSYFIPF
jgi:hypothetical protein